MLEQKEDVRSDLDKLRSDLGELRKDVGGLVRNGVSSVKDGASAGWERISTKAESCVKDYPFSSVLGAAAVGAAIGFLLRGRR